MSSGPTLGVVVNTCNQPDYLGRVLRALSHQTILPDEVLIADDGSGPETERVVKEWSRQQPFRSEHLWQQKQGFRRSRILNCAIAAAHSQYLIFLDGDSVPHPAFAADHRHLARSGAFVQGHRALIEQRAAGYFGCGDFAEDRRRALWTGQLRGLKHAFRWPAPLRRFRSDLRGVRGCNLAIWRADLVRVNGYNEEFVGWGREDSDLSLRLMNNGLRRLDVRGWALCYHLWHPPVSRERLPDNDRLLEEATAGSATRCKVGLDKHLGTRTGPAG
jgi:glycosyltransferase involved in cell wall biosynthesis